MGGIPDTKQPEKEVILIGQKASCAELRVCCHVPAELWYPCYVTVYSVPEGEPVLSQRLPANQPQSLRLPEGEYRVRVRNTAGLDPGGHTSWLRLHGGECACLHCYFAGGRSPEPVVTVDITVTDAHYPGILPINGGITLWQQPITS